MTITLTLGAWWVLPTILVIVGVAALLLCMWWGEQDSGFMAGLFEGLLGLAIFFVCVAAAAGILIGRWLS